jgi:hypothetical protein
MCEFDSRLRHPRDFSGLAQRWVTFFSAHNNDSFHHDGLPRQGHYRNRLASIFSHAYNHPVNPLDGCPPGNDSPVVDRSRNCFRRIVGRNWSPGNSRLRTQDQECDFVDLAWCRHCSSSSPVLICSRSGREEAGTQPEQQIHDQALASSRDCNCTCCPGSA